MEFFDPAYTQQLAPLVWVDNRVAKGDTLIDHFRRNNIADTVWDNCILKNRLLTAKYIFKFTSHSGLDFDEKSVEFEQKDAAHSILSPFNPKSPLFPNGILTSEWVSKYLDKIPFAYVVLVPLEDATKTADFIASVRLSLGRHSIKVVAIVRGQESEFDKLKQLTNTKLVYFHNENGKTEAEVLVKTILSGLTPSVAEFYTAIEARIKQRHKKYYTVSAADGITTAVPLTPHFLETRNLVKQALVNELAHPHNLEPSLRLLEAGHEQTVLILRELVAIFSSDTVSEHDQQLYRQVRSLLDMLAFHIVRGYLSVEQPVAALRKFYAHISNVTDAVSGFADIRLWLAVQYRWLGEFLSLVPESVLADLHSKKKAKALRYSQFFGGIRFHDSVHFTVLTHPGLLFLKSVEMMSHASESKISYLDSFDTSSTHKIKLLKEAKNAFASSNDGETVKQYVDWLIAEEYRQLNTAESLKSAVVFYENVVGHNSDSINSLVSEKLLECYLSENSPKALPTLVNMALVGQTMKVPFSSISDVELESNNLVDIDILLTSAQQSEVFVYDSVLTQLHIKPKLEIEKLQLCFDEPVEASIIVKNITITCTDSRSVSIQHSESADNTILQSIDLDKHEAYLSAETPRVVQFSQVAEKAGTRLVEKVSLDLEIRLSGSKTVTLTKTEEKNFANAHFTSDQRYHQLFSEPKNGVSAKTINDLHCRMIRLHDFSHTVRVLALKPDVAVTMGGSTTSIIIGEKISLPFTISYNSPKHHKLECKDIYLSLKVSLSSSADDATALTTRASWDDMKDDELLSVKSLVDGGTGSETHVLHLSLNTSPQARDKLNSYSVVVDLGVTVHELEGSDDVNTYEIASYTFPVINQPFSCQFVISPRFREESDDMPNPFVLGPKEEQNHSMPVCTRVWAGRLKLTDNYSDFAREKLEIVLYNYTITTKTDGSVVEMVDSPALKEVEGKQEVVQVFTTRSKQGVSRRNVSIWASIEIKWKRPGENHHNEFQSTEWEIVLPLSDPRVLLVLEEEESNRARFRFVLENPTPRIFTFTTAMLEENETKSDDLVVSWNFDDVRNLVPLRQSAFPVLPFTRHEMEFYGQYVTVSGTGTKVPLPTLKVYDIHYKIGLPTLTVTDNVTIDNNVLYWVKNK